MAEDGQGTPPAEVPLWNLGGLEDHLISPTRVTDGDTEKRRSSYRRISGGSGTRTQAPGPGSVSFAPFRSRLQMGPWPRKSCASRLCCPLPCSHIVSVGSGISCWPTGQPGPSGHVGPLFSWRWRPRMQTDVLGLPCPLGGSRWPDLGCGHRRLSSHLRSRAH